MEKCIRLCRKIPFSRGISSLTRRGKVNNGNLLISRPKIQIRKAATARDSGSTTIGVIGAMAVVVPMAVYIAYRNDRRPKAEVGEPEVSPAEEAVALAEQEEEVVDEDTSTASRTPVEDIPKHAQYLLIGAGTASFAAFRAIKAHDPKAKILIVGQETHIPYMRPPLSKELWWGEKEKVDTLTVEQWNGKERSIFFEPEAFYTAPNLLTESENGGVSLVLGHKVVKLEPEKKTAHLADGTQITFDKCLIATGGRPRNLPVVEKAGNDVTKRTTLYRTIDDFKKLNKISEQGKSIAVIGGGFLGSELSYSLAKKAKGAGNKIYQIFPETGNLGRVLPEYLSKWTTNLVKEGGVEMFPSRHVKAISFENNQLQLTLDNDDTISADQIVVAVGLEPNTDLAKTSGLEVDEVHGGYRVNAELEARSNIWVAGDTSCFYDIKLGRRRVEHHDHAVVSGKLAGENMAGAGKPYWHQSMFWSDMGPENGFEAIGIIDSTLETVAVFTKATDKDTPKAAAEETGEGLRSETQKDTAENVAQTSEKPTPMAPQDSDQYGKGVVFYLKDKVVVGMVLWNSFGKMPVARKVLRDGAENEDLYEVAKLFNIHQS